MFAVVTTGSKQFIVKKGDILQVELLEAPVESNIELPVLFVSDEEGKELEIGTPTLENHSVVAKVLANGKTDKVRVYKMNRRKRNRVNKGHRQNYTEIEITDIK